MTATAPEDTDPVGIARPATYREVFAVPEFRPLFGTFLLSTAGDELARVALTVLVYERTSSPLLSALTFAISHFPWLIGGPFLSTLADRLPRHRVLIATDVVRALVLGLMAIPGMPLLLLLVLLLFVSLCAPPFESARSALMADVLDGDRYAVATSLTTVTLQVAQVAGFLAGGALVALHPSLALGIDAATFAISALWLAARAQNLGLGMVSILDPARVEALLGMPEDWRFVAWLCIGHPAFEDDLPLLHRVDWQENAEPDWVTL